MGGRLVLLVFGTRGFFVFRGVPPTGASGVNCLDKEEGVALLPAQGSSVV